MADKKITTLLYGADRELWRGDKCSLTVTKVEPGNSTIIHREQIPAGTTTLGIELKDVEFDQFQSYVILIKTPRHRSAWHAVSHETFLRTQAGTTIETDETILRLMLVANRTQSEDLADGYGRMLQAASPFVMRPGLPRDVYSDLNSASAMALLNIESKLRDTRVGDTSLLAHVRAIRQVEPARVYLYMSPDARRLVGESGEFANAPGHGEAEGLGAHPESWKHKLYSVGNVQLSFAREPEDLDGTLAFSVDVDIDLARGIGHVVEWLDNNVFKVNKTDQRRVYALLYGQGITPYYTLEPLPPPSV